MQIEEFEAVGVSEEVVLLRIRNPLVADFFCGENVLLKLSFIGLFQKSAELLGLSTVGMS